MFQIDERSLADARTLVTIQPNRSQISRLLKSGTINFTSEDNRLWLTTPDIRQAYLTKQGNIDGMFDRILTAVDGTIIEDSFEFKDNQKFLGSVEIAKDIVVRGNMAVLGDYVSVDATQVTIEDNIIELNKTEKGNGVTLDTSGIAVNRGSKGFSRHLFSETLGGFAYDIVSDANANITDWSTLIVLENKGNYSKGDMVLKNTLHSANAKLSNNLNVNGTTTLNTLNANTANFSGDTNFSNVAIAGSLTVNGQTTLNNTLNANKPANFKDTATFNGNVASNGKINANAGINIQAGAIITSGNLDVQNGTLHIKGNTTLDSDLSVKGNATFENAITVKKDANVLGALSGDSITTNSNFALKANNGAGIKFWESDSYKIYMSAQDVKLDATSDYNMYFKMTNDPSNPASNRGFVFKNGNNAVAQIDGSGIIRAIGNMYSNNSKVLTQADTGAGNGLDADKLDGKHYDSFLLRDGSLSMTGDLKLGNNKLRFSDDDYILFDDTNTSINGTNRGGIFNFRSDDNWAVLNASAYKSGNVILDGSTQKLSGINYIYSPIGEAFKLSDQDWLRINQSNSFTSGVYFSNSIIRTDNEIQIGNSGNTLKANAVS